MEIILREKVVNLGTLGDIVRVKAGYARNFLIPSGKAFQATRANKVVFEAERAELERLAAEKMQSASGLAEKMAGCVVTLFSKAGDEGRLFGSVGVRDVADALVRDGYAGVERQQVRLPQGPIRSVGEHKVVLHLYTDVNVEITVHVKAES
jgi:large subunit ribosomal protein L9